MTEERFPELVVTTGNSGVEIQAKPGEVFQCVEFSLKADYPQTILISPWIQFQSVRQQEWRMKWATEIARRAAIHDNLVMQIADLQKLQEHLRDQIEEANDMKNRFHESWRRERIEYGFKEDFTDYKGVL